MNPLKYLMTDEGLTITMDTRLDTTNTEQTEAYIQALIDEYQAGTVILDCTELNFVSSAGLRMILRLKQSINNTKLVNVNPNVYDVLQTTGFTELMEVQRIYRVISVKDCEKIGQGANGVETDVRRTKDGTLVLFHDDGLERVTDGVGSASDHTLAELKNLKVYGNCTSGFYDRIPTLREFLEKFAETVLSLGTLL